MPYHIQIMAKNQPGLFEGELDLSKEQVEERFAKPYLQGSPIFIAGATIEAKDISTIRIFQTDESSKEIAPRHEREQEQAREKHSRSAEFVFPFVPSSLEWSIHRYGRNVTNVFITGPMGSKAAPAHQVPSSLKNTPNPYSVMVVHGRDDNARKALFGFLRAIGLKPIEWSQAVMQTGQGTPYIGDVLDAAFSKAQAAVILLTPDDEARLHKRFWKSSDGTRERELTPQARPNVLFEAGMAFGRYPDRSIIMELGQLRPFSDITGRHVIRMDNSIDARHELAQRLETAGCLVDRTGTDWHTAGDFRVTEVAAGEEASEKAPAASGNAEEHAQKVKDVLQEALRLTRQFQILADGYSIGKIQWDDIEPQRMALVRLKAALPYTPQYGDIRQAIDHFADAAAKAFYISPKNKKQLERAFAELTTRHTNLVAAVQGVMDSTPT
jgi:predicted nucleotide-binding protein